MPSIIAFAAGALVRQYRARLGPRLHLADAVDFSGSGYNPRGEPIFDPMSSALSLIQCPTASSATLNASAERLSSAA
jgi:hypothetical protein